MACILSYIPERLRSNGRASVNKFDIGEHLYRRCNDKVKANPFSEISLIDISVNRSGIPIGNFSYPNDVLFNTAPERYDGREIINEEIFFS